MTRRAVILRVARYWECPNCDATHVTQRADVHTPMHTCPGLKGLSAPYVEAGTRANVIAVSRGDYLNGDEQTTDDEGRPIAFIVRERADGADVWAHAGLARVTAFKPER